MIKRVGWILTPLAFCLGCTLLDNGHGGLVDNAARTLVVEPSQYCAHEDLHHAHICHLKSAEEAWGEFCKDNQGHDFSREYVEGFICGFADFLDAGGACQPPPLPPRTYWDHRTCPQSSLDWFAGYRVGAGMAEKSGLRRCAVVPTKSQVYNGAVLVYPSAGCCPQPTPPVEAMPLPAPKMPPGETVPPPAPIMQPRSISGATLDNRAQPLPSNPSFPLSMPGDSHESR